MYRIGIVGDGYTAAELLRLMVGHERFEAVYISSTENIGRPVSELYPELYGRITLNCEATDINTIKQRCDAVFLALPHGLSVPIVKQLAAAGIPSVDLGADFRLRDAGLYKKYYELEHEAPEMLPGAVYGIPELHREDIKKAPFVANPGCFPTSAIVPLTPLLQRGLIEPQGIIIDSKSGVSGAGRGLRTSSLFCEIHEGIHPYGVGTHRHGPEIAQELSRAAGEKVGMVFTPHLVPMNRGILSTIYCRLKPGVDPAQIRQAMVEAYAEEAFFRVLPPGIMPHTKWVYGSNDLHLNAYADQNGQAILFCAIDNLCRGASGQAIQNMNLMLGLDEGMGLNSAGVHP